MGILVKSNNLSGDNWIVKHNTLNEIRNSRMTLSQIRLFSVYLSKINPFDIDSRVVTFSLEEYVKIMDFKRLNITRLKRTAEDLLGITVKFIKESTQKYDENELREFEMTSSLLFKRFKLHKNNDDEWMVIIECHYDIIEFLFDLQNHFFKYKLWNALQLNSSNQQRMYEILKQYEKAGARELSVKDLREFLGLQDGEYKEWADFRKRVLEASQTALAMHTDIKFTWEIAGRKGRGGKIEKLKFYIEKNENCLNQITFDEFLENQKRVEIIEHDIREFEHNTPETAQKEYIRDNIVSFLQEACNNEFSTEEMAILHGYIVKIIPHSNRWELDMYDYLQRKYNELNWRAGKTDIKNRFGYIKKILESEAKEVLG